MGFTTDLLPYRSPVFELGITIATLMYLAITVWSSTGGVLFHLFLFLLGASLTGSSIVIAAIECDLGKQEILKNNQKALATVSGIIDGIAGFGSVLGQVLIGPVVDSAGWRVTFTMLTIATGMSALPALSFVLKDIRKWREERYRRHKRSSLSEPDYTKDTH